MPNYIDLILACLIAYFFLLGFMRGFLRSVFGPLALIAGSWIAFVYYQTTQNIFITFIIGIFAPMAISIFLRFILSSWLKSLNPEAVPSAISRMSGALITLLWGWTFVIFTTILLHVIPVPIKQVVAIQTEIHGSIIAQTTILPFQALFIPSPKNNNSTESVKEMANDPRLADLMNDPEIKAAAQHRDYAALIKNPKIMKLTQEMMADPALMKRILAMYGETQKK